MSKWQSSINGTTEKLTTKITLKITFDICFNEIFWNNKSRSFAPIIIVRILLSHIYLLSTNSIA